MCVRGGRGKRRKKEGGWVGGERSGAHTNTHLRAHVSSGNWDGQRRRAMSDIKKSAGRDTHTRTRDGAVARSPRLSGVTQTRMHVRASPITAPERERGVRTRRVHASPCA